MILQRENGKQSLFFSSGMGYISMLLEQLQELKEFGLVDKNSYEGFPLKVEYFLTERGRKMLAAIKIMQDIGIEYMVEHGMTDFLDQKGISY